MSRLLELALKKQRLLHRSDLQRRELKRSVVPLLPAFAVMEGIHGMANWVRQHRVFCLGILMALIVVRPRRAFRWGWRAWLAWSAWHKFAAKLNEARPSD